MSSSGRRYPYIYSQNNPFPPQGDFQLTARFRYPEVQDCGVGIIMTSYLVPVGLPQEEAAARQKEAETHGIQAGVWQDRANGMQIWFRSGSDRADVTLPGPNTRWNEIVIKYALDQYSLYVNGSLAYTSRETSHRPQYVWLGHPADLGASCRWASLAIDYIRVEELSSPTATLTETPSPSPTPVPTCALRARGDLASVWRDVKERVGCPTNNLHETWSAVESFQHGWMYWREDTDRIYVMHNNGIWQDFADIWNEGEPESTGLTPPSALLEPKRGFGKVWRVKLGGAQAAIGWATEEEQGVHSQVQDFQRGVMLLLEGRVYVFYREDESWSQP